MQFDFETWLLIIASSLGAIVTAIGSVAAAFKTLESFESLRRRHPRLLGKRVQLREISRARKLLQDKLQADGYRYKIFLGGFLRQRKHVLELAQSFAVSLAPQSTFHDAQELVSILSHRIDKHQEAFAMASETGSGKTVLGMLLPLLCEGSPELKCAALYLGPADWANGPPLDKIQGWIASWPRARRKLIVFDSINEILSDPAPLRELLAKVKEQFPSGCGFLLLYQPVSAKYAEEISSLLAGVFRKKALELRLHFDPTEPRQCAAYRHLFPGAPVGEVQLSHLLRIYSGLFPGYDLTRLSATFVLRHLYDSFRRPPASRAGEPAVRPPGDILFDAILFPGTQLDHPSVELLSRIAFEFIKKGLPTAPEELATLGVRLQQAGQPVPDLGDSLAAAQAFFRDSSLISVQVDARTVRIPNETHVQALAALLIARMIAGSEGGRLPRELEQLRGRSKYDACAPFILPAYRRIAGRPGALYEVLVEFLKLDDAPFSFCARLLHSNYDFSLLSREESEDLSSRLLRKLIQVIDLDRQKTCEQSILYSPTGPNPVLDQLFEVVAAYGDSVVRLLVDNILLTSQTDLEKSQGAYLILYWLEELFAAPGKEARLARRHHIYTILNGLEVLDTANLHIRFHVMEVLDFLRAHSEPDLNAMPGFRERLRRLLERYSRAPEQGPVAGGRGIAEIYGAVNRLISSWAASALVDDPAADNLPTIADKALPPLLASFAEVLAGLGLDKTETGASLAVAGPALEPLLECYEVLLGLTRRTCSRYPRPRLIQFIKQGANSPLWIVRWWAVYNMSHLVVDLDPADGESTVSSCLEWMTDQVLRTPEPIGLKHRQCERLADAVHRRPGARHLLRPHLCARPPINEAKVVAEYAHILDDEAAAARSLEEYFRKLRKLREEYC